MNAQQVGAGVVGAREAAAGAPVAGTAARHCRAEDVPSAPRIEHGTAAFVRTNCAIFASGLATFALLYCVQPLMPVLSDTFHVGATGASLSLSLTTAFLAVSILIAGALSETWGRKPMMVGALLLSSMLTLVSASLHHWESFLVARALLGIALSGLPAVAMAYVAEEMHPRSLGLAMGLYVAGSGMGGMAGRLLVGVITDLSDWRMALVSMGLIGLVCAAILWRCLPASRHFVARPLRFAPLFQTYASHLRSATLRWLFVISFLLMGSFVTLYNYVGYKLAAPPFSLTHTQIGLVFSVYLCGVVSSACMGSVSQRVGRPRMLPITFGVMLIGALLTCAGAVWAVVLGIALMTIGFFGTHAVASAWVSTQAPVGRAQAASLYLFTYYLGSSVLGSLGGVFWTWRGWPGVVAMIVVLLVAGMGAAWRLRKQAG
jgi:YNFM family putative membrane transporter